MVYNQLIINEQRQTPDAFNQKPAGILIYYGPCKDQGWAVYRRRIRRKGAVINIQDIEFIHTNKVTHVINTVARRIPNIWEKIGVQYLCFNWTDTDWNVRYLLSRYSIRKTQCLTLFSPL